MFKRLWAEFEGLVEAIRRWRETVEEADTETRSRLGLAPREAERQNGRQLPAAKKSR